MLGLVVRENTRVREVRRGIQDWVHGTLNAVVHDEQVIRGQVQRRTVFQEPSLYTPEEAVELVVAHEEAIRGSPPCRRHTGLVDENGLETRPAEAGLLPVKMMTGPEGLLAHLSNSRKAIQWRRLAN